MKKIILKDEWQELSTLIENFNPNKEYLLQNKGRYTAEILEGQPEDFESGKDGAFEIHPLEFFMFKLATTPTYIRGKNTYLTIKEMADE